MNEKLDEEAVRRSNRRQLIGFAIVLVIFAGPLLYALTRYLIRSI